MKPSSKTKKYLAITRSKGKMYEYFIPENEHIKIDVEPAQLFDITIGILGKLSAAYNRNSLETISLVEPVPDLQFSAHFFDAYFQSRLDERLDSYLKLLASTAYYLSGVPGSSKVLADTIDSSTLDLEGNGLEKILAWLLQGNLSYFPSEYESDYKDKLKKISDELAGFDLFGIAGDELFSLLSALRQEIYDIGTPREILLVDSLSAVIRKKYLNSVWRALPDYSDMSQLEWSQTLSKDHFVKELWPAQHLLGQNGVFSGESVVVQMPTSAGKTKATEFLIRSAFLSGRASLAVIVAPFRALCNEIKHSLTDAFISEEVKVNELSDILQTDFDFSYISEGKSIIVLTPEKLLYILRKNPEIATSVGLLILDEGHQFDNGIRGVTYELLVTTLLSLVPETTQKVLISAVISNADVVGKWLNGEDSKQVSGTNLEPTSRSIGFFSWGLSDKKGQIRYVANNDIEREEFFVPGVIERIELNRKPRELSKKTFPQKDDSNEIALSLSLKLIANGSVAIFCGKKSSANKICAKVIDLYERKTLITWPNTHSEPTEVEKLHLLFSLNMGTDSIHAKSAKLGVFAHHTGIPHGLRLAVEQAMRNGQIKLVVCTSTLAQGVNLPLKYLIVTGLYQGREKIKTRDFHNLMGRAGRSGMYTEGSVLFAYPFIYDRRGAIGENWRWHEAKNLLEPTNSEPCTSNLLSLFKPFQSEDGKVQLKMNPLSFIKVYTSNPDKIKKISKSISKRYSDKGFTLATMKIQFEWKMNIISAIESFLMSEWEDEQAQMSETKIESLASSTLAYFIADVATRANIVELFKLLAQNISENVVDASLRKIYGRTMYGMKTAQAVEAWVKKESFSIISAEDDELLDVLWPLFSQYISCAAFQKCDMPEVLLEVAKKWIAGEPFVTILEFLQLKKVRLHRGTKKTDYKIDNIVEICESGFSYDGTLLLSAVTEFFEFHEDPEFSETSIQVLELMQKKMKYGLPTIEAVLFYELGFSDRIIAQELALNLSEVTNQEEAKRSLFLNLTQVKEILSKYPSYFQNVFDTMLE